MKIQLANRTYHQTYGGCCESALPEITQIGGHIKKITCPNFIPQNCHRPFERKLFNDKIFKL